MENENKIRNLVVELRILEGTAETLQSRMNFLDAAFTELGYANRTLEALKSETTNANLLVPIGGGSYIKANLVDAKKIIYGVGAGVAIEKTLKDASAGIEERISQLSKTKQSFQQQLGQVLRRIQEDQNKLQEISSNLKRNERS